MKLNVSWNRKAAEINAAPCEVVKTIELPADEFARFGQNLMSEYDFIEENNGVTRGAGDGGPRCLLVLGEGFDDGILVDSQGSNYARYSAYIPNARQLAAQEQRYDCVQDLESRLMNAADEVMSCADAYDGGGPFRALISDLAGEHGLDERYIPLLVDMLNERHDFAFEAAGDEIVAYPEPQEKQAAPLPYSPRRMGQLLDKALDWIGTLESGGALYNTLAERLNMSDEEISAAGFDSLGEYFRGPDESENSGMTMQ